MPTYKNNSNNVVALGHTRIEPREAKTTDTFYKNLPAGVDKISDTPVFDPIVLSQKVTSTTNIDVPDIDGAYRIKIYCTAGEVSIKYNGSASSVALLLGEGMEDNRLCLTRIIDSISITISSGTCYVTIEKQ